MFSTTHSQEVLNISQNPGREEGEFLVSYLSVMNRELNLLVTASGSIVVSKSIRAKSGVNVYPLNLKHLKGNDFVISLLNPSEVLSMKMRF